MRCKYKEVFDISFVTLVLPLVLVDELLDLSGDNLGLGHASDESEKHEAAVEYGDRSGVVRTLPYYCGLF